MKTKKFRRIPAILGITLLVAAVALITVALALPSGAAPLLDKSAKITFYDVTQDGKLIYADSSDDESAQNALGYNVGASDWTKSGTSLTFGSFKNLTLAVQDNTYTVSSLPTYKFGKSGAYFSFYTLYAEANTVVIVGYGEGFSETSFNPTNSIVLEPDETGKYTIDSETLKKIPTAQNLESVQNLYVKAVDAYPVTLPASSVDFAITDGQSSARLSGVQRVVKYTEQTDLTYTFKVTSSVTGKTPVVGVECGNGEYELLEDKGQGTYEIKQETLQKGNVQVLVSLRDPVTVTYTDGAGSRYTVTAADDTKNAYQLNYGIDSFSVTITGGSTVNSVYTVTDVTAVDADGNKLTVTGPGGKGNGKYKISADGGITSNVTVTVTTTETAKTFNVTVNGKKFPEHVETVTGLKTEGTTVSYGSTLTFSVTPAAGYTQPVVTYKVGGSGDAITLSPTGTTYSIPNVTADIEVTINMPEQIKFTVSKNLPDGVKSVIVSGEDHDQIAYTNEEVTVTLTLEDGYTNATPRMTVNGNSVTLEKKQEKGTYEAKLTSGVTSDLAIAVSEVAINTYTVTDGNTSSVKNYTLTFTSGNTFTHGSPANVSFTVKPALGYTVSSVKVNGTLLKGNSSTGYTYTETPDKDVTIEVEVVASFEAKLTAKYVDNKIVWSAILTFKGGLAKTTYTVVGVGLFFGKEEATISNPEDYRTNSYVGNFSNNDNGYIFVNGDDADSASVAYFCHTDGGEYNDSEYSFDYRIKDIESAARSAVLYFEIEIDGQTMTIFTNVATYSGN